MKMTERDNDLPKTVAVIMVSIPSLVFRTGIVYLRTKRRARRGAKRVMKGMIQNGIPPELARKLADEYEAQLSLRTLMRRFVPGPWGGRPMPPDWITGK
ncbi:MAG: hypothetical protein O8C63_11325 [Candidatus Methanoperedens sp.]|nr:hypothetical protein [Candidatus Methanoperedens sp.]